MDKIPNYIETEIGRIDEEINKLVDAMRNDCDINIITRHSVIEYLVYAKQNLKMAYQLNQIYKEKCECEINCKNK